MLKLAVANLQVNKGNEVGGCEICELEVARTFEQIRKKDGETSQLRKTLYAGKNFIRKRLQIDLISWSSHADPPGAYNHIFSANSMQGLNSSLKLHAGLEFELDRA